MSTVCVLMVTFTRLCVCHTRFIRLGFFQACRRSFGIVIANGTELAGAKRKKKNKREESVGGEGGQAGEAHNQN